jgi:hypothetical protein
MRYFLSNVEWLSWSYLVQHGIVHEFEFGLGVILDARAGRFPTTGELAS